MRLPRLLVLLIVSSSAIADSSISDRFRGVQRLLAPDGSVISESRVFVDGGRLRLEISQREGSGTPVQILLVERATGEVHFVSDERRDAMRLDPSRPIHYLSPDFLMVVPLFEEKMEGRPIVRSRVREEQVANQTCDVLEVTLAPGMGALVFVNQKTRLPVRVELGPRPRGPRADWSDVVAGPQKPELFVVPADYKIRTLPEASR